MSEENQQLEEKVLFTWQAEEFKKPHRTWRWYLGFIVLVVLGGWYAWYVKQWLLFGALAVLIFVVFLSGRMSPKLSKFVLGERAIISGKREWSYSKFKSFWLERRTEGSFLHLIPKSRLGTVVSLPLGDLDFGKLREILSRFLPEDTSKKNDVLGDITRRLGI